MLDSPAFSVFCFPFSAFRPSFSRCAFKRTTSFGWGSYFLLPAAVLEISHSAECDQGLCPMDPAAFKKAGEIFFFPSFGWGSFFYSASFSKEHPSVLQISFGFLPFFRKSTPPHWGHFSVVGSYQETKSQLG